MTTSWPGTGITSGRSSRKGCPGLLRSTQLRCGSRRPWKTPLCSGSCRRCDKHCGHPHQRVQLQPCAGPGSEPVSYRAGPNAPGSFPSVVLAAKFDLELTVLAATQVTYQPTQASLPADPVRTYRPARATDPPAVTCMSRRSGGRTSSRCNAPPRSRVCRKPAGLPDAGQRERGSHARRRCQRRRDPHPGRWRPAVRWFLPTPSPNTRHGCLPEQLVRQDPALNGLRGGPDRSGVPCLVSGFINAKAGMSVTFVITSIPADSRTG